MSIFKKKLETIEGCEKAIRFGWVAALVNMAGSLIFGLVGIFYKSENVQLNYFLDPWLLVDVVIAGILAWFIFKKSRVATTLMVIYYVLGKAVQWYELGEIKGVAGLLLFLYFYVNAMLATYIYHAKFKSQNAQPVLDQ